jgi:hypothetical protein
MLPTSLPCVCIANRDLKSASTSSKVEVELAEERRLHLCSRLHLYVHLCRLHNHYLSHPRSWAQILGSNSLKTVRDFTLVDFLL